jgi:hypothetical protein
MAPVFKLSCLSLITQQVYSQLKDFQMKFYRVLGRVVSSLPSFLNVIRSTQTYKIRFGARFTWALPSLI